MQMGERTSGTPREMIESTVETAGLMLEGTERDTMANDRETVEPAKHRTKSWEGKKKPYVKFFSWDSNQALRNF